MVICTNYFFDRDTNKLQENLNRKIMKIKIVSSGKIIYCIWFNFLRSLLHIIAFKLRLHNCLAIGTYFVFYLNNPVHQIIINIIVSLKINWISNSDWWASKCLLWRDFHTINFSHRKLWFYIYGLKSFLEADFVFSDLKQKQETLCWWTSNFI